MLLQPVVCFKGRRAPFRCVLPLNVPHFWRKAYPHNIFNVIKYYAFKDPQPQQ